MDDPTGTAEELLPREREMREERQRRLRKREQEAAQAKQPDAPLTFGKMFWAVLLANVAAVLLWALVYAAVAHPG